MLYGIVYILCADGDSTGSSGRLCCSRVWCITLGCITLGCANGESTGPSGDGRLCCSPVGPITICSNDDCIGPSGRLCCSQVRSTITLCTNGESPGPSGRLCCSRVGSSTLQANGDCIGPSGRLCCSRVGQPPPSALMADPPAFLSDCAVSERGRPSSFVPLVDPTARCLLLWACRGC